MIEATWWAFTFQIVVFTLPIVGSYFAYRQVQAGKKTAVIRQDLILLGLFDPKKKQKIRDYNNKLSTSEISVNDARQLREDAQLENEIDKALQQNYTLRDYVWPITYTTLLNILIYSFTHPYTLGLGLWDGVIESSVISIFGETTLPATFVVGRAMFWAWCGAYIYAFNTIFRRFMSYDLTPSVYMFVATRLALAFFFGAVVIMILGVTGSGIEVTSQNTTLMTASITAFFVGFFPERALDYIALFGSRILRQGSDISNEIRLAELEGLSVWHQGRLKQQDVENVQNLATADIPLLVVATPFTISQIIDWVDQAILIVYANEITYRTLESVGIRTASDFILATEDPENEIAPGRNIEALSSVEGLSLIKLQMLRLAMLSASNIHYTAYYRWHQSIDPKVVERAEAILPLRPQNHDDTSAEMLKMQPETPNQPKPNRRAASIPRTS